MNSCINAHWKRENELRDDFAEHCEVNNSDSSLWFEDYESSDIFAMTRHVQRFREFPEFERGHAVSFRAKGENIKFERAGRGRDIRI